MKERKSHRKTRSGCITCKKRRIKCDEEKPSCQNCSKRSFACTYAYSIPTGPSPPPVMSSSSSGSYTIRDARTYSKEYLELIHHWSTSTCFTVSKNVSQQSIWQTEIPRLGFIHDFLLDAVVAIAGLHKRYLIHPTDPITAGRLLNFATSAMDRSLAAFRKDYTDITPENCAFQVAFSSMVALYMFSYTRHVANPFKVPTEEDESENNALKGWLKLVQSGFQVTYQIPKEWIEQSTIGAIYPKSSWRVDRVPETEEEAADDARLAALEILWQREESSNIDNTLTIFVLDTEKKELSDVLQRLRVAYLRVSQIDREIIATTSPSSYAGTEPMQQREDPAFTPRSAIMAFLLTISESFITLVQQRNPFALVVMAYYGALLVRIEDTWWIDGFATDMIEFAIKGLGENSAWAEWPARELAKSREAQPV